MSLTKVSMASGSRPDFDRCAALTPSRPISSEEHVTYDGNELAAAIA